MTEHITDLRKRPATLNEDLFYAYPNAPIPRASKTLIHRPMEWFLRDLASIAKETHPDLMLCWIRDALLAASDASEIQLFTGAADWHGQWTLARGHLIGSHGYRYLTLGFVEKPEPRWIVVGARHVQVWHYEFTHKQDDDTYTRDAKTL